MKSIAIMAVLASTVVAQPKFLPHKALHVKRDVAMYTETDYVTEVVTAFTTLWVPPNSVAPTGATSKNHPAAHSAVVSPIHDAEFYQSAPSSSEASLAPVPTTATNDANKAVVQDYQTTTLATSVSPAAVAQPTVAELDAPVAPPASDNTSSDSLDYGFPKPSGNTDLTTQCSASSPCNGKLTHYTLSDGMACGYPGLAGGDDKFRVIALPFEMMGQSSNEDGGGVVTPINANCDRVVEISCPTTGKTTTAIVVDKCMGCYDAHIDLSPAVFTALGITADIEQANWNFIS